MNLRPPWTGEACNLLVLVCVLLALGYVPIPLGSNRPLAWYGWEILVYGTLCLWLLGLLLSSNTARVPSSSRWIMALLLVWLALVLLQTLAVPSAVVATLNPLVYSLQQNLGLISVGSRSALSIDPGNTFNELLKYGSYVAVFVLILATVTTRRRLLVVTGAIVVFGVLEALFGIYSQVTGYVILPEHESRNELRAGTFVNRNHFGNLLTMVLGLLLGLLVSIINSRPGGKTGNDGRYSDSSVAMLMVLIAATLVIVAGIFTSGSRSPIVFLSLSIAIILPVARSTEQLATGEMVLAPVLLVGAAVLIVAMGFDDSMIRLLDRDLFGGERMLQNAAGLELLSGVWFAGVGAGNYRWVFQMYRGDELRFVTYDHAHNDYLETAIELGIPAAMILGAAVVLILRELYRGYRYRRNPLIRGVIFGCLVSMIFMLLHALVEFNFRIPANAAYFFAIAAVGLAACRIDRRKRRRESSTGARRPGATPQDAGNRSMTYKQHRPTELDPLSMNRVFPERPASRAFPHAACRGPGRGTDSEPVPVWQLVQIGRTA